MSCPDNGSCCSPLLLLLLLLLLPISPVRLVDSGLSCDIELLGKEFQKLFIVIQKSMGLGYKILIGWECNFGLNIRIK